MKKVLTAGLSPAIQKTIIFERLSKGEVNRASEYLIDAAGKSINVCRVLTQAGINAEALVPVGVESRERFEELCRRDSIAITACVTQGRVRYCYTLLDRADQSSTEVIVNEPEKISETEEKKFKNLFLEKIEEGIGCVIVSGSRHPGFSSSVIPFMLEETVKRNISFVADYKGEDLRNSFIGDKIRPDYVKINENEFAQTFGSGKPSDTETHISSLSIKYNNVFVITRGEKPTIFSDSRGNVKTIASKKLKPVNTTGCGDAFTAGFAEGVIRRMSLDQAVERGRDYSAKNALSLHPGCIDIREEKQLW